MIHPDNRRAAAGRGQRPGQRRLSGTPAPVHRDQANSLGARTRTDLLRQPRQRSHPLPHGTILSRTRASRPELVPLASRSRSGPALAPPRVVPGTRLANLAIMWARRGRPAVLRRGAAQCGTDSSCRIASVVDPFGWLDAVEEFLATHGVAEVGERFSDAQWAGRLATGDERCPGIDPGPGRCRPFARGQEVTGPSTMTGGPPSLRQLPGWKSPCTMVSGRPHSSSSGNRFSSPRAAATSRALSSPATGPSSSARICLAMLRVRRSGSPGGRLAGGLASAA